MFKFVELYSVPAYNQLSHITTNRRQSMKNIPKEADRWATAVWRKNVEGWQNRNQDHNYRKYLARPAIQKAIRYAQLPDNGKFIDLGCGDGSETAHIRDYLRNEGAGGRLYGFDLQESLISKANETVHEEEAQMINTVFENGHLEDLIEKHGLNHKADNIFSTFLLQELSDAEKHLRLAMRSMRPYLGRGIFALLHPDFGQAMLDKGAIKVNQKLGATEYWRWAGEYPIVEEGGKTFYVPYFHRTLDDYKKLICDHFCDFLYRGFKPTKRTLQISERKKLSPFYGHPGNVYFPEITTVPSTLIFIVGHPRTMPQIF